LGEFLGDATVQSSNNNITTVVQFNCSTVRQTQNILYNTIVIIRRGNCSELYEYGEICELCLDPGVCWCCMIPGYQGTAAYHTVLGLVQYVQYDVQYDAVTL
jgi:hypothetical protein